MIHEGTTSATGRAPHLVHRIWVLGVLAVGASARHNPYGSRLMWARRELDLSPADLPSWPTRSFNGSFLESHFKLGNDWRRGRP